MKNANILFTAFFYLLISFSYTDVKGQSFARFAGTPTSMSIFDDATTLQNGNHVAVGSIDLNLTVVIYSPTGQELKRWQDSNAFVLSGSGITNTADGGFAITGGRLNLQNNNVVYIMYFNDQGDSIWSKEYQYGPNLSLLTNASSILQTPDNGFIITGQSRELSGFGSEQIFVLKTDAQGDSTWYYEWGGGNRESGPEVVLTNDGGYFISGMTNSFGQTWNNYFPFAIKLDSTGAEEWAKTFAIEAINTGWARGVQNFENEYIIAFILDSGTVSSSVLLKIDALGDSITHKIINTKEGYHGIALTQNGEYILTGYTAPAASINRSDLLIAKIDKQFNEVSHYAYVDSFGQPVGLRVRASNNDAFLAVGFWGDSAVIIKTDSLGYVTSTLVRGKIVHDANSNCIADTGETAIGNHMVKIDIGIPFYGISDNSGNYAIRVFGSGQATVFTNFQNNYWESPACQGNATIVNLPLNDTLDLDLFAKSSVSCPLLTVNINSIPISRVCRPQTYLVNYCNNGTTIADSTIISIKLEPDLTVLATSIPYTTQSGSHLLFNIGSLGVGECGSFTISTEISCSTLLGQTLCVEAHIYPDSICLPPDPAWDGSSVKLTSKCENDTITFELQNQGTGDMSVPLNYIIVEDNVMYSQGQFQLLAGQLQTEVIPGNGKTYTMIAEQSEGHPGNSNPLRSVEGCGSNSLGAFSLGYTIQFPQDDENDFIDILCQPVFASYDPNDKTPEPLGLGTEGYINATQQLDYTIQFQNTGTDTAFLVVLRDTLPQYLDITTLQLTGASHAYTFQIIGSNVLEWTFNNILLPDSNVNEPASHGYVSFHISQVAGNAVGTEIRNRAGIYFDFNPPVITNYTLNTVVENFWDKFTVSISEISNNGNSLQLYPNPNNGQFYIELQQPIDGEIYFKVYDLAGKQLLNETYNGSGPHTVAIEGLNTGMYLYQLTSADGVISTGKVLISK